MPYAASSAVCSSVIDARQNLTWLMHKGAVTLPGEVAHTLCNPKSLCAAHGLQLVRPIKFHSQLSLSAVARTMSNMQQSLCMLLKRSPACLGCMQPACRVSMQPRVLQGLHAACMQGMHAAQGLQS